MNIGKNIKKIRRFKNITQEELSEKLAMSPQAYSKIENGETKLDTTRLDQIAQILGVTLQDICELEDKSFILNQLNNSNNSIGNGIIVNSENQKLIAHLEKTLAQKDAEIDFLRAQVLFFQEQFKTK